MQVGKSKSKVRAAYFLFIASLAIAILLIVGVLLASVFRLLAWPVSLFILRQILAGLLICSSIVLFVRPRVNLLVQTKGLFTKLLNSLLVLFFLAIGTFLLTLCSTLWPAPEMSFSEKYLADLAGIAGGTIGLYTRHLVKRLTNHNSDHITHETQDEKTTHNI